MGIVRRRSEHRHGADPDYQTSLSTLAQIPFPPSDWCSIHLVQASGNVEPVAVAHVDPRRSSWSGRSRRVSDRTSAETGMGAVYEPANRAYEEISMSSAPRRPRRGASRGDPPAGIPVGNGDPVSSRASGLLGIRILSASRPASTRTTCARRGLASRAALPIDNVRLYKSAIAWPRHAEESPAAPLPKIPAWSWLHATGRRSRRSRSEAILRRVPRRASQLGSSRWRR